MRSFFAGLRSLMIPDDAQPDDPATIISGDDNPVLQALNKTGILFRTGLDRYFLTGTYATVAAVHNWFLEFVTGNSVVAEVIKVTYDENTDDLQVVICESEDATIRVGRESGTFPDNIRFELLNQADFLLNGVSQRRGLRINNSTTASTADIGTSETVISSTPPGTFQHGRCYRIYMSCGQQGNAANNIGTYRYRSGTIGGAIIGGPIAHENANTINAHTQKSHTVEFANRTGVDITNRVIVQTLQASAGTVRQQAFAGRPRIFRVEDIGDEDDYPEALDLPA